MQGKAFLFFDRSQNNFQSVIVKALTRSLLIKVVGLVAMLTYHLFAQFYYRYLACFKPLGFATFSCSLIVREHVFYCAISL